MRTILCFLLLTAAAPSADVSIRRLAGAAFQVADLEKARQFYTGILGLEMALERKEASGATRLFFRINGEQWVEFSSGGGEVPRLEYLSLLVGGRAAVLKDPRGNELRLTEDVPAFPPGKPPGERCVTDRLQHVGLPVDPEPAAMAFYRDKLGFRETFRGGPKAGEIRYVIMAMPTTPGDILELMIAGSLPVQARQHLCFDVPDMQRAYKQLIANGQPGNFKPFPAGNGRWVLNLRDPNGLRVEFMGEEVKK
jgi:catechol 2,3-dioxygenase-like lactoylglutathione lyase family enzyme